MYIYINIYIVYIFLFRKIKHTQKLAQALFSPFLLTKMVSKIQHITEHKPTPAQIGLEVRNKLLHAPLSLKTEYGYFGEYQSPEY